MNQNLKKIMEKLSLERYRDYGINEDDFDIGFEAAIPHVREEILNILRGDGWDDQVDHIEKELKRMDEE